VIIGKSEKMAPPALPDGTSIPVPPLPPLTPEMRDDIHKRVTGDLRRIGVGAGLILLFIPLFILAVVSKFFIDRSRASLRVADDKRREAEFHRMSQQVTEAKLQALQAQVEPHFLYNTLASVQALTEVDPQRANTLTGHLIMYLRNALPKMRESISTVGQEVELVRSYLNILKMRMGDRLNFEIEVPKELENAPFPPLMLPTLVENAIKHGLEPLREGGTIVVKALGVAPSGTGSDSRDGVIRMSVADTGKGFADSVSGSGVGLANIRERLAAIYGDKAKLTLEENQPRGVVSAIEVPRDGTAHSAARQPRSPAIRSSRPSPSRRRPRPRRPSRPSRPASACGARVFPSPSWRSPSWRPSPAGSRSWASSPGALPLHFGRWHARRAHRRHHRDGARPPRLHPHRDRARRGDRGLLRAGFVMVGLLVFVTLSIVVALVPALAPLHPRRALRLVARAPARSQEGCESRAAEELARKSPR
jgi:hypothetical protein